MPAAAVLVALVGPVLAAVVSGLLSFLAIARGMAAYGKLCLNRAVTRGLVVGTFP